MSNDERFGRAGRPHHLELAVDDHEEPQDLVADIEEHFTARDRATMSVGQDPRNLRGRQRRKQLFRSRCGGGLQRKSRIGLAHALLQAESAWNGGSLPVAIIEQSGNWLLTV